jgi:hypothetical protein
MVFGFKIKIKNGNGIIFSLTFLFNLEFFVFYISQDSKSDK